ncbi:MAG: FtsW/RodA/SpoVE family cell cycle protein [Pelagibacteraceae bacterium]|jgi:cell division protein FtsW|nr:cell division protein FtsW [Candidatus Pelagibacter sp.]MDP6680294.1 FtsW/RodA/SpoVE family cell cycle protein [Pelagibacteraceae bacterium]MDP6710368.1 FtsW/RodA/SpoVE family cell cycle protein [Pelagibacteraceae bacterium]
MFSFSRENTSLIAKWWRNIDKQILFLFLFLLLLGLFFSFSSTSSIIAEKMSKETYFFFIKHLIFVFVSLLLLIAISIQEKNKIIKFLLPLFLISILFLLLVIFIGEEIKGSKRWIDFPILPRFQPIELVKPFFVLIIAKIIVSSDKMNIYNRYLFSFFILSLVVALLISQPDIGQTLLIISTWITMVFASGFNMIILSIFGLVALVVIVFLIYFFPSKFGYISLRIQTFLNPKTGDNFQSQKALDAIKQGGLTGQGMGEGVLKDQVPEAHTDYIIAVISEEFGALFVLLIVILFLFIGYKIFSKVLLENDEFIKLSLIGLTALLIIQTFIHIGVNVKLFPTTGMTLPFLSYGGSSLIGTSIIAGIILNFTRKDFTRYINNE